MHHSAKNYIYIHRSAIGLHLIMVVGNRETIDSTCSCARRSTTKTTLSNPIFRHLLADSTERVIEFLLTCSGDYQTILLLDRDFEAETFLVR